MSEKMRLDLRLVSEGLAESREKAKAIIMSGVVYLNGQKADKPGQLCRPEDKVERRGGGLPYVSRGGFKLEKALAVFPIDPRGRRCIDVGASTGGFTDCLLQNGAASVCALDVGYGQLAWKLRSDPRVTVFERTNIRTVEPDALPGPFDLAVTDVSFISLRLVLPRIQALLTPDYDLVALIKPQFEAGRERVGKKGVVSDPAVHFDVVKSIVDFVPTLGWRVEAIDFSPIRGPEGNMEFLAYLLPGGENQVGDGDIEQVVAKAHESFKREE